MNVHYPGKLLKINENYKYKQKKYIYIYMYSNNRKTIKTIPHNPQY